MKRIIFSITIVILQLFFLCGMIIFHAVKLNQAARIMLKTVPYDPLSIFRGRYVSLRYEISSVSVNLLKDCSIKDLKGISEVFLFLEKEGDYWQAKGIYRQLPKDRAGIYIRGRLPAHDSLSYIESSGKINLDYGIESFFLNEVSANEVDKAYLLRPGNWSETERKRKELISQLDTETQRIIKAGISRSWFNTFKKEAEIWLKDGLIDTKAKDDIYSKYARVEERRKEIEKKVNPALSSEQEPIVVEVAVDKNGYGYPTRLFIRNKEYK